MSVVNLEGVLGGILLGMIVAIASYTVSKRFIFEKLRLKAKAKSKWLGELVGCHWCLSFWFAMLANILYFPRPLMMPGMFLPVWTRATVDFIASWFFIAAVSSFLLSKTFDHAVKLVVHHAPPEEKETTEAGPTEEERLRDAMSKIIKRFG